MEYKIVGEDRYEEVITHLRKSFFTDEPLNKAVALCKRGEGHPELENHSLKTLQDNVSVMALNENDEIVGVQLNGILKPGYVEVVEKKLDQSFDENYKKIFQFLNMINKRANIFDRFDVEKIFEIRMLSVDERYRGKGIAKELVQRSEQIAKDRDFKFTDNSKREKVQSGDLKLDFGWYISLGFAVIKVHEFFDEDYLRLQKL